MRARIKFGALAAIVGMACGGTAVTGSPDGGFDAGADVVDATVDDTGTDADDGGATTDSGGDEFPVPTLCPPNPPGVGSPCSHPSLMCEYGTSNDPLCNSAFLCDGQSWANSYRAEECRFGGTNDPTCPTTYAEAAKSGACTGASVCEYPEGRCECAQWCGGVRPPPDAGSHWACSAASPGCPSTRGANKLGTPCAPTGLSCNYTACCTGLLQTCSDAGVWAGLIGIPCP